MKWDKEHNLTPIQVKTTPDKAKQFINLCTNNNVSRQMVFNELIKEFNSGEIDVGKKEVAKVSLKVDYTACNEMTQTAKKTGYSKASVLSLLLDYFIQKPNTVLKNMGIEIGKLPQELIEKMRETYKKVDRPLRTTDVENPRVYSNCFGTWATAIYVGGSISYDEFILKRRRNRTPFDKNELTWILSTRINELKQQGLTLSERNFDFPGTEVYQQVMGMTPLQLLQEGQKYDIL